MTDTSYPKVVKETINLGELPYFDGENDQEERVIKFHEDHWIEKFPRVVSLTRINDALEINLFMEHRFTGKFMPPKYGGQTNPMGGITLSTLNSMSNSMCLFLKWIEENNIDWQDVNAVNDTDKAKYWLPVYRYRKHLIDKTIAGLVNRDTANLYMTHVRQLYEWIFKQRRIDKLPFQYYSKVIKKTRNDSNFDLLFTNYAFKEKGVVVTTTDLNIPKKHTQKKINNSELSPYSEIQLQHLYATSVLIKDGAKLKVDLALYSGLRQMEVASFSESYVEDPGLSDKKVFFIEITGKYGKRRTIMVAPHLMQSLWRYSNSTEHQNHLSKWQMKYGNCANAPLFLNSSGEGIQAKSVGNLVSKARKELKLQGIDLKNNFHDLRSTFATNLAGFMLKNNLPIGFIQFKLMDLMGHNNFSTTQKYINFAHCMTFDQKMASWVDKLFDEMLEPLQEGAEALTGEI